VGCAGKPLQEGKMATPHLSDSERRRSCGRLGILFAVACFGLAGAARAGDATITDSTNGTAVTVSWVPSSGTCIEIPPPPYGIYLTGISGLNKSGDSSSYFTGSTPLFSFALGEGNEPPKPGTLGCRGAVDCQNLNFVLGLSCTATSVDGKLSFAAEIMPALQGSEPGFLDYPQGVIVKLQVTYTGADATAFVSINLPDIQVELPGTANAPMAMVPYMFGGVMPLTNVVTGLGAEGNSTEFMTLKLPTALNALEVAVLYDGNGVNGGVFFADLDGNYNNNIAPLQLRLTKAGGGNAAAITGYWTAKLKRGQPVMLPRLAIGTHRGLSKNWQYAGDWHSAVDYYVGAHSWYWAFPDTPKWLREAGAIYLLGESGGGSFLATFPATPIENPDFGIHSFACPDTPPPRKRGHRCLLDVYDDARKLGTNVIYLTTWSDRSPTSDYYHNAGDWVVRQDMGGAEGLRKAIDDIRKHDPGFRVILYLSPSTVASTSILMQTGAPGPGWERQAAYPVTTPFCDSSHHCMSIANTQWQDYLINRAVNLMKETHVDGFFLDTWGYGMNIPALTTSENVNYGEQQSSAAALRFVDRLRTRLRGIKPDAIVMGENNGSELPLHWDGGSGADLSFWLGSQSSTSFQNSRGYLWASPVRYAMPLANSFVNGSGINGPPFVSTQPDACGQSHANDHNSGAIASVNQIIASGHNLALGPFFLHDVLRIGTVTGDEKTKNYPPNCEDPSKPLPSWLTNAGPVVANYIKSLVQLRSDAAVKDALTYGNQIPTTTCPPFWFTPKKGQNYGDAPCAKASISDDMISDKVAVYLYQGEKHQVLAIVNNTTDSRTVPVRLDEDLGCGTWQTVLGRGLAPSFSETGCSASNAEKGLGGTVTVTPVPPVPAKAGDKMGGLAILVRPCGPAPPPSQPEADTCAVPPRQTFPYATIAPLMNETFSTVPPSPYDFTVPPWGTGMSNWTDWAINGTNAVPTGVWSPGSATETTHFATIETSFLQAAAVNKSALLFYDLFGGGDFTYVGGITVTSFGGADSGNPIGAAGLSFRLSDNDNPSALDAGNQGYDVVLTNDPILRGSPATSGSVRLMKRQPSSPPGGSPSSTMLCEKENFGVVPNRTYQLSITAQTLWKQPMEFPPSGVPSPDPNQNAYPVWSVSTTFTVSVDGTQLFTCVDSAPYFSGRFGVNATNVNAQFSCLQANGSEDSDGPMPPTCAPIVIRTVPPPGPENPA
jgi:hypothetical protein